MGKMIQVRKMYENADEGILTPGDVLANAIILQAVKDFRRASRKALRRPDDSKAARTIREVSRFFRSRYFCLLTRLDGPELLERLTKEICDEPKRPA